LGKEHADVATSLNNLALVLQQQGSLVEAETSQCEALLMQTKLLGVEHPDVATSIANLANLLKDQERLVEAEALHREALRMREKLLGAAHPDVASSFEDLARLLIEQGRVFEAEPLAERCAAILQNQSPAGWRLFYASSLIGCALLGQKKYTEAEPFLLSGYRGMKQREDKIPVPMKQRLREAVERIVELYAAWGKPEKAGEWKSKLPEP